jgi:hypothetical protein
VSKRNTIKKIGRSVVSFDGAGVAHLLTVEEVAGVLRCSVSSLNKWRVAGCGPPFVHVGHRVRYRAADLNAYIAAHTVTSTSGGIPPPAMNSARRDPPGPAFKERTVSL